MLPIRGTASLVMGINSDTIFIKTVRDSNTVTPTIFDMLDILSLVELVKTLKENQFSIITKSEFFPGIWWQSKS